MNDVLKTAPKDCSLCPLSQSRTQVVYPDVFQNSKDSINTLIIGEAPGANEDKKGKPFVGASGKILRKELHTLPGTVIITNTVKCRPPENRNPKKEEKDACNPFLKKEIDHYNPDYIILVGRIASSLFIPNKELKNFTDLSGIIFKDNLIPILHPASTMYNAKKNRPVWLESWDKIRSYLKEKYPDATFREKEETSEKTKTKSLIDWVK